MYFKFDCPQCGKSLKVREDQAGRKARCPYCHSQVPIPMPAEAGSALDEVVQTGATIAMEPMPLIVGEHGTGAAAMSGVPAAVPVARARRREAGPAAVQHARMRPSRAAGDASAGTNISMLRSGVIGLGITVIFYLLLLPVRKTYLGMLFYERGWVQFALTFLLGWSAAVLLLKMRKLRAQRDSMMFDLLPTEIAAQINIESVDAFTEHVRSQPVDPGRSFLINRVLRGLEHFRVRKSHSEVAGLLSSQSEIDATAVESSYSFVKVCVWAIPILGFIGTVQGISSAVGGFSGSLEAAKDIEVLKHSLNDITGGLAVAFDTTLVALMMSLLVMFPMSSLQKSEEDLLNWVDEYCNENLLKRLEEAGTVVGHATAPRPAWESDAVVRAAVQAAMAGDQGQMVIQLQKLHTLFAQLQQRQIEQLDKSIAGIAARAEQTQHDVAKSMMEAASGLEKYFGSLERSIASLNTVLHELGGKVSSSPQKKSWWPFGRSNGR